MSTRTFKVQSPHMKGDDIKAWQHEVKALFKHMKIDCPIKADGDYGVGTRAFTADLVHANGLSIRTQMKDGVTPELRTLLRNVNDSLTAAQKKAKASGGRHEYRANLRRRWGGGEIHTPVDKIVTDAWGWHPGVHDGVDVVTDPDPVIYAMVKSRVIDVRDGGWWGLGAPKDPKLKAKGDGIIQLEVLEDVGPFKKGMHIGYGHAEKAMVNVGQTILAGKRIGHAGFANAWHIHLMVNDGSQGLRGVGTQDPRPLLDYAVKNG